MNNTVSSLCVRALVKILNLAWAGGWVAQYSSGAHALTFLTIKGAGHMSPQWKPLATITWLTRWLNRTTI